MISFEGRRAPPRGLVPSHFLKGHAFPGQCEPTGDELRELCLARFVCHEHGWTSIGDVRAIEDEQPFIDHHASQGVHASFLRGEAGSPVCGSLFFEGRDFKGVKGHTFPSQPCEPTVDRLRELVLARLFGHKHFCDIVGALPRDNKEPPTDHNPLQGVHLPFPSREG